jgi:hypothetical protein
MPPPSPSPSRGKSEGGGDKAIFKVRLEKISKVKFEDSGGGHR